MKRARFKPTTSLLAFHASSLALEFVVPARDPELFESRGACAIVEIEGPTVQKENWIWDSYEAIGRRVDAALASPCSSVVLKINSPGGEAAGVFELARDIRAKALAAGKLVVSYVDGCALSAGYALACAGSAVYVPSTGQVGSIGVIKELVDIAAADRAAGINYQLVTSGARKADGHPRAPITADAIAAAQTEVDGLAGLFFGLVAEARGTTAEAIAGLEAATLMGASAVSAKLADGVTTFEGLLAMVANGSDTSARASAEKTTMTREELIAGLVEMASGEDGKDKDDAIAALAGMGLGPDGKPTGDGPEATGEAAAKAEGDGKPPADDEEKKAAAKAATSAPVALALASQVQSLTARLNAMAETEERSKLMASRPDFTPEVAAFLDKEPIATVRNAVKSLPKAHAKGQVAAARAAIGAAPTLGATQSDTGARESDPEKLALDVQMGLASPARAMVYDGTKAQISVMTPPEARAEQQRRSALKSAQKGSAK